MENETINQEPQNMAKELINTARLFNKNYLLPASIIIAAAIFSGAMVYSSTLKYRAESNGTAGSSLSKKELTKLEEDVLPSQGVILPVTWGDLGKKLVNAGVIDPEKLKDIYNQRGSFTSEYQSLLTGENNGKLTINIDNSGYILNLLWALGLAQKNEILEKGEMVNPAYGGAKNFASTGGWTLAKGDTMTHYSKHQLFTLTPDEQALVEKISQGIYRPCCNNSTHFPDCNHGMAMLGLLELMASQGVSEAEMWKIALAVNSYWFPNNYLTIATYMKSKGVDWKNVKPEEMLGVNYSSSRGYANIASRVSGPSEHGGGGGCGV